MRKMRFKNLLPKCTLGNQFLKRIFQIFPNKIKKLYKHTYEFVVTDYLIKS